LLKFVYPFFVDQLNEQSVCHTSCPRCESKFIYGRRFPRESEIRFDINIYVHLNCWPVKFRFYGILPIETGAGAIYTSKSERKVPVFYDHQNWEF
jgi:hypothetical protein